MEEAHAPRLIVGLGNPGPEYDKTRHNIGFRVVRAFAEQKKWSFRRRLGMNGEFASGDIQGGKVFLLLPHTYMNRSGESVRRCAAEFMIVPQHIMVVSDDAAIPFGKLRLRKGGSAGGHNGLKSVEEHLGTQEYPRLRVGIGAAIGDLADYVLDRFTDTEEDALPKMIEKAVAILNLWIEEGTDAAIHKMKAIVEEGE